MAAQVAMAALFFKDPSFIGSTYSAVAEAAAKLYFFYRSSSGNKDVTKLIFRLLLLGQVIVPLRMMNAGGIILQDARELMN